MEYRLLGENRNGKLRGKKSVVTGKNFGELFFRPFSWKHSHGALSQSVFTPRAKRTSSHQLLHTGSQVKVYFCPLIDKNHKALAIVRRRSIRIVEKFILRNQNRF
jgi:hypothetical protein